MGSAPSEPLRRKNFRTSHIVVFQPNIMELRCQSEYVCVCCEYSGRHACFCVLDVNESSALFLCITTCDVILRTSAHNPTGGAAVGSSQIRLRFSGSASVVKEQRVGQPCGGAVQSWAEGPRRLSTLRRSTDTSSPPTIESSVFPEPDPGIERDRYPD